MEFLALFIDKKLYVECPKQSNGEYGLSGSMFYGFGMKKQDGKIWIPKSRLQEFKDTMKSVKDDLKTGEITGSYRKFSDFASQLKMLIDMYVKISRAKGYFELTLGETRDQILTLNTIDPSGKEGTYMRWLVKMEASSARDFGLDYNLVGPLLKRFDQLRKIPAAKGKFNPDINSYNSISELRLVIEGLADIKSKKSQEKDWKSTVFSRLSEFGKVDITSNGYTLVKVDNPEDVIKFCALYSIQKTWCIYNRENARRYAPIIFIISGDKIVGNYSVKDVSFWDRQDNEVVREDWIAAISEFYPKIGYEFIMGVGPSGDQIEELSEVIKVILDYMGEHGGVPRIFLHVIVEESAHLSVYYATHILKERFLNGEEEIIDFGSKRDIDEYCYVFGLKLLSEDPNALISARNQDRFVPIKSASYRKFSDLESLMPALIQMYRKHSGVDKLHRSDYTVESHIRHLNEYDPSGEKADYTRWLVMMSAIISPDHRLDFNYDMDWVEGVLARYDELKRTPRTKEKLSRDISTFKTVEELKAAIDVFHGLTSKKKEKERKLEGVFMNLEEYGDVKHVSGGYTILYVNNVDKIMNFLHELGITSWCIKDDNYVYDYAPISFIIAPGGKVVANMESSNFYIYDRGDSSLPRTHEYYKLIEESGFKSQMRSDRQDIEDERPDSEEDMEDEMEAEWEEQNNHSWEIWAGDEGYDYNQQTHTNNYSNARGYVLHLVGIESRYEDLPDWQKAIFDDIFDVGGRYIEFEEGDVTIDEARIANDYDSIHQRLTAPDHPNQLGLNFSKEARYRKF